MNDFIFVLGKIQMALWLQRCTRWSLDEVVCRIPQAGFEYTRYLGYLLGIIEILPVQRWCHGSYQSAAESRCQSTVSYFIPNDNRQHIKVCKNLLCMFLESSPQKSWNISTTKKTGWKCL